MRERNEIMKTVDIPMISVIIPTYNRMKTLPRAIKSVLNQTYQNIELIIVDDGSTDGTEEYIAGLQDSRITYVKNEKNLGPSATRNKGAQIAKGEYIAFQDSDDDWKIDKLEKQMKVMQDENKPVKMVYCEIAMYDSNGKFYLLIPSKKVELQKKEGDLFSYLLLNALISTQTMLIERKAFLELGGFNEQLQSYEDWEFSLRFAERHQIGFVEEDLAQVHYSSNSVNQRYPERIRTQMYMMQEMISQLRERGMLRAKLEEIQYEASSLNCYSTFVKEWKRICGIFTEEERELFELIIQGATNEGIKRNTLKIEAEKKIENINEVILQLYETVSAGKDLWVQKTSKALIDLVENLAAYGELLGVSTLKADEIKEVKGILNTEITTEIQKMSVLQKIFVMIEKIQGYIKNNKHICNVCGKEVFYDPIPNGYEVNRKKAGFLYWNADFQLESKEKYGCPICSAYDRDRLMIAFLNTLQSENDEKLKMLHVAPSRAIEMYALGREDIIYESTDLMMKDVTFNADLQDMNMVEDEAYDIIVCSHVLEHVEEDAKAMKELHRILKPDGVCLVLVPLAVGKNQTDEKWGCSVTENWRRFGQGDHSRFYGKRDFINRLQSAGFRVNELDKSWFGEEFYQRHGFDDLSIMYVATKELCLVEECVNEVDEQEKRILDLEQENLLLKQTIMNLSDRVEKLVEDRQQIKKIFSVD